MGGRHATQCDSIVAQRGVFPVIVVRVVGSYSGVQNEAWTDPPDADEPAGPDDVKCLEAEVMTRATSQRAGVG
jgi:hypothetical protein